MWTITEVKKRAWGGLKNYYWKAVGLDFIVGFMSGLSIIPCALAVGLVFVCPCLSPVSPFVSMIVAGLYEYHRSRRPQIFPVQYPEWGIRSDFHGVFRLFHGTLQ